MATSSYVKLLDSQRDAFVAVAVEKYKMDSRVISKIVNHPSFFLHKVMQDPNDERPIRWKYFGAFALRKHRFKFPRVELT